jgi:predicted transcriptional regulator
MSKAEVVEKIACEISDSVLQSYLVSSSGVSSRTISRICTNLEGRGLIIRKKVVLKHGWTYLLKTTKDSDYESIKYVISNYL